MPNFFPRPNLRVLGSILSNKCYINRNVVFDMAYQYLKICFWEGCYTQKRVERVFSNICKIPGAPVCFKQSILPYVNSSTKYQIRLRTIKIVKFFIHFHEILDFSTITCDLLRNYVIQITIFVIKY